jgi:carotenoid cleavage dioxygenase-like enzyme
MLAVTALSTQGLAPNALSVAQPITQHRMSSSDALLRARHGPAENEVMNDLFRPAASELDPAKAKVIAGALPADLPRGVVLKNGPNPQPQFASEQGGWLDGDGMIHAVLLPPDGKGEPTYSRTWVRTQGFVKEAESGKRLFDGSLVAPRGLPLLTGLVANGLRAGQPQKDTANTGLLPVGSDGRCLALMEQCLPTEVQVCTDGSVVTLGAGCTFDGQLVDYARHPFATGALTAHLKTDPATGEKVGVTYPSNGDPGARVTTLAADGTLASDVMIPLKSSVQSMIHDCALTPRFTVLLDLPMTVRPRRMLSDKFPVEYEPEAGGRIGLCQRGTSDATWFEVEPCVVLHTVNAHESPDGKTVTLTALRSVPSGEASFIEAYSSAFLHRWVLDLESGEVSEATLSDVPLEFPAMDGRLVGRDARFAYAITPSTIGGVNRYGPPYEGILIDAVVKLDLRTGGVAGRWQAPEGFHLVSEPSFVPKLQSSTGEGDEGYLLVYVCAAAGSEQAAAEVSEVTDGRAARLYVIDAEAMPAPGEQREPGDPLGRGAVAALSLPGAVPYGLHSCWVPYEHLPPPNKL